MMMKSNRSSSLLFSAISLVAGFFLAALSSGFLTGRAPATAQPSVTVSGVIYTETGEPYAPARVELASTSAGRETALVDETGPAGQFAFRGVAPGQYVLRAFPEGAERPLEWQLTVQDRDIVRDFRARP